MKYVFLDGEKIASPAELHRVFAETLSFPDYYGKNLDALRDCLTDVREPVTVIAVNTALLRKNLGRKWKPFLRLMDDLQNEEPDFRFFPEPFPTAGDTPE